MFGINVDWMFNNPSSWIIGTFSWQFFDFFKHFTNAVSFISTLQNRIWIQHKSLVPVVCMQNRVSCRERGGSKHIALISPTAHDRTSIFVLRLCITRSWLQTVLFSSNFNPILWAVTIRLIPIGILRLDAQGRNASLLVVSVSYVGICSKTQSDLCYRLVLFNFKTIGYTLT